MTNKSNVFLFSFIFLVVGLLIGWVAFSGDYKSWKNNDGMHMMQGGVMDMEHAMGSMMSGLQGKKGDDFDKAFLEEMIVHHEGAVEMAEMVLKESKRPELIKLANDIIAAQTKEIEMMQDWNKVWFK